MPASPPPVLLRPRRDADLPALVRVLADQQPVSRYPLVWPLTYPPERFVRRPAEQAAWVAELDGAPVGHVSVTGVAPDDPLGPIWAAGAGVAVADLRCVSVLFVARELVGHGVGGLLLDRAVGHIRGRGATPVLDVVQQDTPPAAVYRHRGWIEVGTARPDWLPDGARDVLLMALPS